MRTLTLTKLAILIVSVANGALGQAWFELANKHIPSVDAPVFDAQGIALAGTNYLAELWGGATPNSLTPLSVIDQGNRRMIVPFVSNGYFLPAAGQLTVLGVPANSWAWLEVRAWDARLGLSYEDAVNRGLGGYGNSPLFYAQGGNPFDLLGVPAPLIGLQSFSLLPVVPEPSAVWLFLLGAPFLRLWRSK
jgi:hypothetical protein